MFGRLKRINASERYFVAKRIKREVSDSPVSDIIESSVLRLTQLITVNRRGAARRGAARRAAASFYFRRYDERNHASLAILSRKVAAQVQALGSMGEE